MKKTIIFLSAISFSGLAHADLREIISNTTKHVVSAGKDIAGGVTGGVNEGRKETEGSDGAITVTNGKEMVDHLNLEVVEVTSIENNIHITVGFKNRDNKPIRIANMDDKGIVLLIDRDGYSIDLSASNRLMAEFTVPASAGVKKTFIFNTDLGHANKIRFWDQEFKINPSAIKSK